MKGASYWWEQFKLNINIINNKYYEYLKYELYYYYIFYKL